MSVSDEAWQENRAGDALDMDVVASLKELGGPELPDLFAELVETFCTDSPPRVLEIERGIECEDPTLVGQAAHGLKSSAANMGALDLAEICRRLEVAGREGRMDEIAELQARPRIELERATRALRAL